RRVIPILEAGYPRVTHPCATLLGAEAPFSFDLHVLGTPPAFVLSQDQTLQLNLSIRAKAVDLLLSMIAVLKSFTETLNTAYNWQLLLFSFQRPDFSGSEMNRQTNLICT